MASDTCLQCRRGHHGKCTDPDACACTECGNGLVEWEDPPGGRGRRATCPISDAQLDLLRSHVKRWAKVIEYDKATTAGSTAGRIKKGAYPQIVPEHWEIAARRVGASSALYLRYLGGDE